MSQLKMNEKGSIAVQILILLVVAVVSSAIILFLVRADIISPKEDNVEDVLNTEFLPMGRSGDLVLKEFDFCNFIDESSRCYSADNIFKAGDVVYLRFLVESSVYDGNIMLVRNYRIKDPSESVILNVEEENNYYLDLRSSKEKEQIAFADYFTTDASFTQGEYTLDIIIENPLFNKKITASKKFILSGKVIENYESGEGDSYD